MIRNTTYNPESPLLKAFQESRFPEISTGRAESAAKTASAWKSDQATFSLTAQVALMNRAGLSSPEDMQSLVDLAASFGYRIDE